MMISRFRMLPVLLLLLVTVGIGYCAYPVTYEGSTDVLNGPPDVLTPGYANVPIYVWPYPTLYGDTGLVQAPTADTQTFYDLALALDYTRIDDGNAIPVRLNYGIVPNGEIFLNFTDADDGFDAFGGGIKVSLMQEEFGRSTPGLAVGARVTQTQDSLEVNIVNGYVVSSLSLLRFGTYRQQQYRIRAHAGVDYLNYSGDVDGDFFRLFGGLSYEHANGTSLVVDFLPAIEDDGVTFREETFSAAIRFPASDNLVIEAGGTRPFGITDTTIYAGFMYRFNNGCDDSGYNDSFLSY